MATYTPTIFSILAEVRRGREIDCQDAEHLYEVVHHHNNRYDRTSIRHYRVIALFEQRTDQTWLRCDHTGWYFPAYQQATTVGSMANDVVFLPAVEEYGDTYVWAVDPHGDEGWDYYERCYFVQCEERYITDRNYGRNYFHCPDCSEIFPDDRGYSNDHDTYCETCYYENDRAPCDDDDDEDSSYNGPNHGGIYSYSTKVENIIDGALDLLPKTRYFGIELEMEFPGQTPSQVVYDVKDNHPELREWAIWKSDGSLNNGAELVSVPMTLDDWRDANPIQQLCNDKDFRKIARSHETTTAGLHIHVTRSTVPEPVVAKVVYLMNEPCMSELTTLIARRAPNTTYCTATKKKFLSDANYLYERAKVEFDAGRRSEKPHPITYTRHTALICKTQVPQHGRYSPVNLTQHTLEFRIFRGTLRWETVLASIEYTDAVISYCTQYGAAKLNATDFKAWLKALPRKTYPALRDYLELRGIRAKRNPPPLTLAVEDKTPAPAECPAPEAQPEAPTIDYWDTSGRTERREIYLVVDQPVLCRNTHAESEFTLDPALRESYQTGNRMLSITAVQRVEDVPAGCRYMTWLSSPSFSTWSVEYTRQSINPSYALAS